MFPVAVKSRRRNKTLAAVWLAALTFCCPVLAGCTVAAYGLGVATMVNDSKVRQREEYENYRRKAEAENALNVMTFRQWAQGQQVD